MDDFVWCETCGNIVDQIRVSKGEKVCQNCIDEQKKAAKNTADAKAKVAKYNKEYQKKNRKKINAQRRARYAAQKAGTYEPALPAKKEVQSLGEGMKQCKQCGFIGDRSLFVFMRNTCWKCQKENVQQQRSLITDEEREAEDKRIKEVDKERSKAYREKNPDKVSKQNHEYYLAHKAESLERCRKNRAKKKLSTGL
jgi:hypothetical protein